MSRTITLSPFICRVPTSRRVIPPQGRIRDIRGVSETIPLFTRRDVIDSGVPVDPHHSEPHLHPFLET